MSKLILLAGVLVLTCLALLIFVFARSLFRDAVYASDAATTKAAILKIVPIGSQIDFAKSTMQSKGFQCQMSYNQRFADDGVAQPAADFLYCDSGEQTVGLLVTKRWQVAFVDKDGVVQSIAAGVGLTGP